MSTLIIPERLALAHTGAIRLQAGGHDGTPVDGGPPEMCINEAIAWIAGEPWSAQPRCMSPVLAGYMMRLNDRLDDERRQLLLPYGERCVGTAGDGQDEARMAIARAALLVDLLPPWYRLAGLDEHADAIAGLGPDASSASSAAAVAVLRRARDAAWSKREAARRRLVAKFREVLVARGLPAGAAGAAWAAEVAEDDPWAAGYKAARAHWKKWFAEAPEALPIRELAESQRDAAFTILARMLNPEAAAGPVADLEPENMTATQAVAHSRVDARVVAVCVNCGRPWDSHLEVARNLLKRDQPETFYLGHDGREYPLAQSIRVESNVTTEACETLGWRRPKPHAG